MKSVSFNLGWYVRHVEDSGLGTPVTLPHDAMSRSRARLLPKAA